MSSVQAQEASYQDFVWRLCKPGEVLLAEQTPSKIHLWHMASALCGEVAELTSCAVSLAEGSFTDMEARENIVEELGDIAFYLTGIDKSDEFREPMTAAQRDRVFNGITVKGLTNDVVDGDCDEDPTVLIAWCCDAVIAAGDLFDEVKKYTIYNKPLNRVFVEVLRLVLRNACDIVRTSRGISTAEIEMYNRAKLSARYNTLVYNDQHAHDRADKAK